MKKPLLLLAATIAAVFCFSNVNAQTITISGVSASYCAGAGSSVTFTASGGTITAASVFSVELSDAAGSFGAPTVISNATFTGALTGSIPITIPIASPAGSGYLMRVVCTSPTFTGSNSSAFTINLLPSVIATPPAQTICSGTAPAIALTSNPVGATFAWTIAQSGTSGATAASGSSIAQILATTAAVQGTTTYTVTATLSGCSGSTTPVVITVNPLPAAVAGSNISFCNAASTVLGAAPVGTNTYAWLPVTNLNSPIASNPTATNTATTTYTVTETITATGCFNSNSVIVTVNPLPAASVIANTTICSGAGIAIGATTIAGHTYAWLPVTALSSASVSNPTASPTATTTYTLTETITATTCVQSNSVIITVNPLPSVIATPSSQSICSGAAPSIALTSSPASATFAWTIAQSGTSGATAASGSSIAQTLSTTAAAIGTTTYTVTATLNSCPGPTSNVVITVNPIPTVTAVSSQTLCNAATTTAVTFAGAVTGTTFGWTNTLASIGLAASGSGNIAPFTATNTGIANTVGTVTVTPTANSCPGATTNFTYTVKPTPTVTAVSNQTLCNTATTTAVTFAGAVTGTTFGWTNTLASIGLAASGSGNIAAFTATNSGTANTVGTVTVTPTANSCVGSTTNFSYTVKPTPTVTSVSSQTLCNTATTTAVTFAGAVTGTTFGWTNTLASIGLAASGSGNIAAFTATNTGTANTVGTVTVTPTANSCPGATTTFTYTVKPTPTVTAVSNQTLCNAATTTAVTFAGAVISTTFGWTNNLASIGLAASGSGNIAAFTATNTGIANTVGIVTVTPTANSCVGSTTNFSYTVKPTPTVTAVSNQTLCNAATTTAVTFAGAVTGTTFGWTNNLASIGLAASGSGNIAAFTATNTGTSNTVGTVTVTPTANSCVGATANFSYTVKPTPTVNTISSQTPCNASSTTAVTFSGAVTGTTFGWTNNLTSIGLAATGSGNIAAFTATNSTAVATVGTVSVTPTANSCVGSSKTFTYTVNPSPVINAITSQTHCNTVSTTAVTFTSPVSGSTFTWTNSTTSIGLAASGSGATIAAFTATNTGSAPVIATITVSSLAGICPGNTSFTFTVNPTPTINAISNQAICNTDLSTTTSFTGAVTGTSFGWTNNLISIGLAATGSGNINAFAAANTSTSPVTATVTVTPTANTCAGSPLSFTYTVNPTPDVIAISSQSLCNTISTAAVTFSGAVTGTTFGWTNDLTSIGLAASGNGNIAAFATANTGIVDDVATVVVTPTANSCPGATQSFTITVKPTPTVDNITNQVFCSGVTTSLIPVTSPVVQGTGTSFAWANSQTSIGLAASGVGDVPAFAAVNANIGTPAVTATVTITPTANGCVGPTNSFTYTINPLPAVPVIATHPSASICLNTFNQNLGVTCATSGVSFAWNATNATITNGAALANAIIDFNTAGSSVINVTATIPATGCVSTANFTATVSATNVSVTPSIIYQSGRFICLLGSADSYQWGSDNKITFAPTTYAGETSQDFVKATPLTTENYWVITVQNGTCTAKSYFTGLGLGLQNIEAANVLSISPNPTSSKINVLLNNSFQLNNAEIKIVNLLGQTVYTTDVKNHEVEINMEPLAANIYFIQVYSNNNLITVQKIVKQ